MKKLTYLKASAVYMYAGLLMPSIVAFADPLNLTMPKLVPEKELRVFSEHPNTLALATYLVLKPIEKKIERSARFVPQPRFTSGEKVYGTVRITVTIRMDGTVAQIEPESNGSVDGSNQLLIEAATKIVELAAPFAPLPREHFSGFDAIRFSRSFTFRNEEKTGDN